MKVLTFSRLCLVSVLALGLLVVYSAATPQKLKTNNSITVGGCSSSSCAELQPCTDADADFCMAHRSVCVDGFGTCFMDWNAQPCLPECPQIKGEAIDGSTQCP